MGYNFIMVIDTTSANYEGNFEQNVSSNFTEVIVDDTTTYTAQQWSFTILNQVLKEYKVEYVFSESNAPTSIDSGAFAQSKLLSITIPSSVTSIGDGAFYMCQEMTSIYFERTTPPTVGEWTFYLQSYDGCTFYVPTGTISTYANTQYYPSNTNSYQEWNPTDTPTTLNGALELLGETMAENLTTMGLIGVSASDGLTTLANDILLIQGGGGSTTIFEDACSSATGLTNYGTSVVVRGTNASATIEYDSTENAYKISGTGNYFAGIPIDPLKDVDNFKITAEMKCSQNSGDCQIGFYTRDYTDTTKQAYSTHLLGDARYRWFYVTPSANGSYQAINTSSAHYSSYTKMEWIVEGTSIKMNIYDSNDDVAYTITKDTVTYDKHEFGFWIDTERGTSYACYVKNIKAESLGGGSDCTQYQTQINNAIEYINGDGT